MTSFPVFERAGGSQTSSVSRYSGRNVDLLEQLVPLIQDLVVIGQLEKIDLRELAELQIHETPPLSRSAFDDIQIFRRKKYKVSQTQTVLPPSVWARR